MDKQKRVIVTGASSGIGRSTALRFAQEGWNVCVTARREQRLAELVRLFPSGRHLICPGDYSDPALAESVRAQIASDWGGADVLATNSPKATSMPYSV